MRPERQSQRKFVRLVATGRFGAYGTPLRTLLLCALCVRAVQLRVPTE